MNRCVIIGAGPINNYDLLPRIRDDDYILCADGGLDHCIKLGIKPDSLLGDFDSVSNRSLIEQYEHTVFPCEKDDTDMMNCIYLGLKKGYRDFLILGAIGGRTAHTYANICALLYIKNHKGGAILSSETEDFELICKGEKLNFTNKKDSTLSIFPFGCSQTVISATSVYYPLKHLKLTADYPVGISNVITDNNCTVECECGTALTIVER